MDSVSQMTVDCRAGLSSDPETTQMENQEVRANAEKKNPPSSTACLKYNLKNYNIKQ